ncbi:hypothetical protein C7382_1035 [Porphyromonas loveana]|uniref:Uncharacterized protein n=1 Tax=Porphyromonas loveana TaxID=1884669 RepID=A0A2U1FMI2_9PORP|nr:hypothetical protein C7382_1035 [Porphyromonas loveana]
MSYSLSNIKYISYTLISLEKRKWQEQEGKIRKYKPAHKVFINPGLN